MSAEKKKKLSPLDPIKVEISTDDGVTFSYDLLDEKNLNKIGISRKDIDEVEPVFAVPGYLYEEKDIASKHHRLMGSACALFATYDKKRFSIDDIWYFDENVNRTHFNGKEHWNHERRLVEHSDQIRILDFTDHVESHAIPTSRYIDISLDPGPSGAKVKKRVFRP